MGATSGEHPRKRTYVVPYPAVEDGNDLHVLGVKAEDTGRVSSVELVSSEPITGVDTNSRSVVVYNRGADGAGTTVVAQKDFVSGVNALTYDACEITLATTVTQRYVTSGDELDVFLSHVGNGITMATGAVRIVIQKD